MGGGINTLVRGISSFDLLGVLSGPFIGEMTLLGFLGSFFGVVVFGPCFLAPDGPGSGPPVLCPSFPDIWRLLFLFLVLGADPGSPFGHSYSTI